MIESFFLCYYMFVIFKIGLPNGAILISGWKVWSICLLVFNTWGQILYFNPYPNCDAKWKPKFLSDQNIWLKVDFFGDKFLETFWFLWMQYSQGPNIVKSNSHPYVWTTNTTYMYSFKIHTWTYKWIENTQCNPVVRWSTLDMWSLQSRTVRTGLDDPKLTHQFYIVSEIDRTTLELPVRPH